MKITHTFYAMLANCLVRSSHAGGKISSAVSRNTCSSKILAFASFSPCALPSQTRSFTRASRLNFSPASVGSGQSEVILVGCGAPNRGMGWYHAEQMLEERCPSGVLTTIVEPWFLGGGKDGPGGDDFTAWKESGK